MALDIQSYEDISTNHHLINEWDTVKPAERQRKLTLLEDGLAKQSEPPQRKFQLEYLLLPLTSNIPAASGLMLISLASANETIPFVCAIVERIN